MGMQSRRFRLSVISGVVGIVLLGRAVAHEPKLTEPTKETSPLRLSTQAAPSEVAAAKRPLRGKVNWKGQEYNVEVGIRVLMTDVSSSAISSDERVLALRALGHLKGKLRGDPCIVDLLAVYPKLETTAERAALLNVLNNSDDQRVLPLAHSIAIEGGEPRLRLLAAAVLARWNVRLGVEVIVEFFPNGKGQTGATLGVDALMLFDVLNRTKGWGCPREEAENPVGASDGRTYSEAVALAESGFRKWFEQSKDRFPDWKPGDPLPANDPKAIDEQKPSPEPK